jgi:hypothetical protein
MPRRLAPLLPTLALVPLLGFAGCDEAVRACTLIGCESALVVSLTPTGEALPAGRYTVHATAGDDEAASCAFRLAPCASGTMCLSDPSEGCRGAYLDGDTARVTLPPVGSDVSLAVSRDGAAVAETALAPAYVPQYPNGVDCGAACEIARVAVSVESLADAASGAR